MKMSFQIPVTPGVALPILKENLYAYLGTLDAASTPSFVSAWGSADIEGIIKTPTTPGILSRDNSSVRLTGVKPNSIPKSKSSSQLLGQVSYQRKSRKNLDASSEWLQRAGAIISSETRESKGQSWLVSRASSTSLVDHEGREDFSFADDEFSPYSPRGGSRVGSRVESRHGSKSKIDLTTPWASRTGLNGDGDDMVGNPSNEFVAEPDFVDVDEDVYGDVDGDVEFSRIARLRGFGLGSWVDRLIGWSLFAVEEDGEESEDHGEEHAEVVEQEHKKADVDKRRKREESERVVLEPPSEDGDKEAAQIDQDEGWQDATWLLSVATKVLF
ncbi:MAG: hypothetical protein M1839_008738 [Geoglossum umbratile]|nr:MAG: hypothetical protein M1839_008738 [Geoglossum umbratile]